MFFNDGDQTKDKYSPPARFISALRYAKTFYTGCSEKLFAWAVIKNHAHHRPASAFSVETGVVCFDLGDFFIKPSDIIIAA